MGIARFAVAYPAPAMSQANKHQSPSTPIVVLLGGPGSGKGAHWQPLAGAMGYQHFSTGEHFRETGRLMDISAEGQVHEVSARVIETAKKFASPMNLAATMTAPV